MNCDLNDDGEQVLPNTKLEDNQQFMQDDENENDELYVNEENRNDKHQPNVQSEVQSAPKEIKIQYNCPNCSVNYSNAHSFTKHALKAHNVKVYACRKCDQFYETQSHLSLHARGVHNERFKAPNGLAKYKFHCTESGCNYMTNNGGTMEHHKRSHTGVKPFTCDICNKGFAQKSNMMTHRLHHARIDKIFSCDICDKSFNRHNIYLTHLSTLEHELHEHFLARLVQDSNLQCLGCNFTFQSSNQFNEHENMCKTINNLEKKYCCHDCKVTFKTVAELADHINKSSHRENLSIYCPICGETNFVGYTHVSRHMGRKHKRKLNKRFVCRYCESKFDNKSILDDHIENEHPLEKNRRKSKGNIGRIKCKFPDCDFTANTDILMASHERSHTKVEKDDKQVFKNIKTCRKRKINLENGEVENLDNRGSNIIGNNVNDLNVSNNDVSANVNPQDSLNSAMHKINGSTFDENSAIFINMHKMLHTVVDGSGENKIVKVESVEVPVVNNTEILGKNINEPRKVLPNGGVIDQLSPYVANQSGLRNGVKLEEQNHNTTMIVNRNGVSENIAVLLRPPIKRVATFDESTLVEFSNQTMEKRSRKQKNPLRFNNNVLNLL